MNWEFYEEIYHGIDKVCVALFIFQAGRLSPIYFLFYSFLIFSPGFSHFCSQFNISMEKPSLLTLLKSKFFPSKIPFSKIKKKFGGKKFTLQMNEVLFQSLPYSLINLFLFYFSFSLSSLFNFYSSYSHSYKKCQPAIYRPPRVRLVGFQNLTGSDLGSGFSKIQFWDWVRVRVRKFSKKSGFGFGFVCVYISDKNSF